MEREGETLILKSGQGTAQLGLQIVTIKATTEWKTHAAIRDLQSVTVVGCGPGCGGSHDASCPSRRRTERG